MNYNDMLGMVDSTLRNYWHPEANVFCGKCGGACMSYHHHPSFAALKRCECTTPKQSWARLSYRDRLNIWIQPMNHIPKVVKWPEEITYRIGRFSVTPRTLSQMTDSRAEDYRNRRVKDAIAVLDSL